MYPESLNLENSAYWNGDQEKTEEKSAVNRGTEYFSSLRLWKFNWNKCREWFHWNKPREHLGSLLEAQWRSKSALTLFCNCSLQLCGFTSTSPVERLILCVSAQLLCRKRLICDSFLPLSTSCQYIRCGHLFFLPVISYTFKLDKGGCLKPHSIVQKHLLAQW